MSTSEHLLYACLWLSFAAGHSLLAGDTLKRWFGAGYRLAYNAIALLHLAAILLLGGLWLATDAVSFVRPTWLLAVQMVMIVAGLVILAIALRGYDLGLFAGTQQLRTGRDDDDENARLDGLHRYVRHPLYSGALLVLWGMVGGEFTLATAIWSTAYFWVGSRFEERRLVARYGAVYRAYQIRVPAFVPWRGRAI